MPIAETIPERIAYYEFKGQPREEWPTWLSAAFTELPASRSGLIATAHFAWAEENPDWYRWYEPKRFWQIYRAVE